MLDTGIIPPSPVASPFQPCRQIHSQNQTRYSCRGPLPIPVILFIFLIQRPETTTPTPSPLPITPIPLDRLARYSHIHKIHLHTYIIFLCCVHRGKHNIFRWYKMEWKRIVCLEMTGKSVWGIYRFAYASIVAVKVVYRIELTKTGLPSKSTYSENWIGSIASRFLTFSLSQSNSFSRSLLISCSLLFPIHLHFLPTIEQTVVADGGGDGSGGGRGGHCGGSAAVRWLLLLCTHTLHFIERNNTHICMYLHLTTRKLKTEQGVQPTRGKEHGVLCIRGGFLTTATGDSRTKRTIWWTKEGIENLYNNFTTYMWCVEYEKR